jgi:Uncharacterized protein conserved in bacteria C-term(DUF2220)
MSADLARHLLGQLLTSGERSAAGVRARAPALTAVALKKYRELGELQRKAEFEAVMAAAVHCCAVSLVWDDAHDTHLIAADKLAAFLGVPLAQDQVSTATGALAHLVQTHPVLADVFDTWGKLRKVRGAGPGSYGDWQDAAALIRFTQDRAFQQASLPIREASARCFGDSKRIERVVPMLDVLLSESVASEPRGESAVLEELGLYREERPALFAGRVQLERDRVTSLIDAPYAGFAPYAVKRLISAPDRIISIENLTTFHREAKRCADLNEMVLYTGGMPSPAWRAMYIRLLGSVRDVSVYHWGDVDEGGFRIASVLAADAKQAGCTLRPWCMYPDDVPASARQTASERTRERMRHFAALAGWEELGDAVFEARITSEQEGL